MTDQVPVESLRVGDSVELATELGPRVVRLTGIERRVNGFKLTASSSDGAKWSFGATDGDSLRRLSPESQPE